MSKAETTAIFSTDPDSDENLLMTIILAARQEIESGYEQGWLYRQAKYEPALARLEKRGLVKLKPGFVTPTEAAFHMVEEQKNARPN